MRKLPVIARKFSRRRFMIGTAAAAIIAGAGTRARAAAIRYRLGISQPLDSPNYIRLKEMADRVRAETGGRMQIDLYGGLAIRLSPTRRHGKRCRRAFRRSSTNTPMPPPLRNARTSSS